MEKRLTLTPDEERHALRKRIRVLLCIFLFCLVVSGLTAFPLTWETRILHSMIGEGTAIEPYFPNVSRWITRISIGVQDTDEKYPLMAYGIDWLGFAHLVIALAFYGPIKEPVKNIWVIEFGMTACILVIPLALICGQIRAIPLLWRVIDCSFGIIGIIPLLLIRKDIKALAVMIHTHTRADENR